MRQDIAGGCGHQGGGCADVERGGNRHCVGRSGGELGQHPGLAHPAVGGKRADARGQVGDDRSVSGIAGRRTRAGQPVQRFKIVGHVAVGRRDQARGPAHHMIAGEGETACYKAQVVAEMAGTVEGCQRPVAARRDIALRQRHVGAEAVVRALAGIVQALSRQCAHPLRLPGTRRAEGQHRGTGHRRQPRRAAGVIEMRMGHEDMRHRLARTQRSQQRRQMRGMVRPRIDDRHLPGTDDPAVGSRCRHRGRVRGQDMPDFGVSVRGAARSRHPALPLCVFRV